VDAIRAKVRPQALDHALVIMAHCISMMHHAARSIRARWPRRALPSRSKAPLRGTAWRRW
jgi:hypothetical protein